MSVVPGLHTADPGRISDDDLARKVLDTATFYIYCMTEPFIELQVRRPERARHPEQFTAEIAGQCWTRSAPGQDTTGRWARC